MKTQMDERAWLELDEDALRHNAAVLTRALPPGCRLMAVVKADAYGHGAARVGLCLNKAGVTAFAVATVDEGAALRRAGVAGEILVLGYTPPERAEALAEFDLIQTLLSEPYARALEARGVPLRAHLKLDTGMHRLGYDPADLPAVCRGYRMKHIRVCGIFTHLCGADSREEADIRFTREQAAVFRGVLEALRRADIRPGKTHILSSFGLLNFPELGGDYARVGLALYGACSPGAAGLHLRPVLSLRARIVLVRTVAKGEGVGYGRQFRADRDSRVAVVSIGYADGVPRALSNGAGRVLTEGREAPILGLVCMDQLMVDVTDIPAAEAGSVVTILGRDGALEITAGEAAARAGTIPNELLSRLGSRLPCAAKERENRTPVYIK